jgi:nucleotide-binding universal stress UspA family protein
MKILVPLDGSPLAERALVPAASIARRWREPAAVMLLRVVAYPAVDAGMEGLSPVTSGPALLDDVIEAAQDYLRATAQAPVFAGITMQTTVVIGAPAATIIAQAQEAAADLIVMSSHGRTGIARLALGSVTETVAREAHVPVLVLRAAGITFPDAARHEPLRILVPLDGTDLAEAAIRPAAELARALHGALYLLRVVPPASPDDVAHEITAHEAYAYLTTWHDRLTHEGLDVHRSLGFGAVAEQIVAKAQEHHADLVAIATHGRTGLARLREGSIAETVIHHTALPALVIHPLPVPAG